MTDQSEMIKYLRYGDKSEHMLTPKAASNATQGIKKVNCNCDISVPNEYRNSSGVITRPTAVDSLTITCVGCKHKHLGNSGKGRPQKLRYVK